MSDNIKDIQERKEQLKQEIRELQGELDESIDEARTDLSTRLKPRNLIREYPLTSIGITFLVGFLMAPGGKRSDSNEKSRTNEKAESKPSREKSTTNGFGAHLWSEIKRSASKKAIRLLMDYVDDMLDARKSKK